MQPTLDQFKESFWRRVRKVEGGCWEWMGKLTRNGYGKCQFHNKEFYVHRLSYTWVFGEIPSDKVLDHLCRNRKCVNPSHLEVVTSRENVLRGESVFAKRKRQTHCIHGHPLSGSNLIIYKNGTRHCRACAQIWEAARPPRKHINTRVEDKP